MGKPSRRWVKAEKDHDRLSFALAVLERIRAEVDASMSRLRREAGDAFGVLCNLKERGWSPAAPPRKSSRARAGGKGRKRG